jgi:hypothetical protein
VEVEPCGEIEGLGANSFTLGVGERERDRYPRCASSAPSRNRTSECTTDVGWTTTSIRSYGMPKSQ